MMNVIQFWLIDSIVKGSNNYAPLALASETPRGSMDPDSEPLFRASEDDDEDDGLPARHDIENPAPRVRSISRSLSIERSPDVGEPKSVSSGTATAIPSGSTTPVTKPIDVSASTHAYPPSTVAGSLSSASSSLSSVSFSKSRRRSPPPPLALKARKSSYPDVEICRSAPPEEDVRDDDEKWAAWGEEEDWAERVGEEDWTGRRLEARKGAVEDAWRDHTSPALRPIPAS